MKPAKIFPTSNETYDAFAPHYREYSQKKTSYIKAVDAFILENLPRNTKSILDIGCGDGIRLESLLNKISFEQAWAVDSSSEMVALARSNTRAEVVQADIGNSNIEVFVPIKFDVIFCLWNVLGHVDGYEARNRAILNMSEVLNVGGRIYIDVSNRYNIKHYGWRTVLKNLLTDCVHSNRDNGTFSYNIQVASDKSIVAHSHFFNPTELLPLFANADLHPIKTIYINYATGKKAGFWSGSMFYVLERSKKKSAR